MNPRFIQYAGSNGMAINTALTTLRRLGEELPAGEERNTMNHHLGSIVTLCDDLQLSVARAIFALAGINESLEAIVSLVQEDEDRAIPSRHLAGLLTLVQRQLRYSGPDSHLPLHDFLDAGMPGHAYGWWPAPGNTADESQTDGTPNSPGAVASDG